MRYMIHVSCRPSQPLSYDQEHELVVMRPILDATPLFTGTAGASQYHLTFLSRRDGEPLPVLPSSRTEGGSCIQDCFIRQVSRPLSYTCIIR